MRTVVQVKRKGFNDSYPYTEYYLHNALQSFGYNLTRDEKTADFSVTAYIDFDTDYFLLTSPFFDQLNDEEQKKFCEAASVAMKSDVMLYPHPHPRPGDVMLPNATVFHFLYSRTSSAYEEPALIENGDSRLTFEGHWWEAGQSGNVGFSVINYGGPTQGLDVILQAPLWAAPFLTVESAEIRRYTKQGQQSQEMVFKKIGSRFLCRLEQYDILPGRNEMSALWCRTRTKYLCAEFNIDLKIRSRAPLQTQLSLSVNPFFGEGCTTTITL